MIRIQIPASMTLLHRFREAYAFYKREFYSGGGGPRFTEFISLCAELTLEGIESEMSNREDAL